jgi:sulfur carrier protein
MKLNGKTTPLIEEETLLAFLTRQQYDCRTVAVERNGEIIPRAEYGNIRLADDDTLEVVRFVGGG